MTRYEKTRRVRFLILHWLSLRPPNVVSSFLIGEADNSSFFILNSSFFIPPCTPPQHQPTIKNLINDGVSENSDARKHHSSKKIPINILFKIIKYIIRWIFGIF